MCVDTLPVSVKLLPDSRLRERNGLYLAIPAVEEEGKKREKRWGGKRVGRRRGEGEERGGRGEGEREDRERGERGRGKGEEGKKKEKRSGTCKYVKRDDVASFNMQWRDSLADGLD